MAEQDNADADVGDIATDDEARFEAAGDLAAEILGVGDDKEPAPVEEPGPEPDVETADPEAKADDAEKDDAEEPAKGATKPSDERRKESLDSLWAEQRRRSKALKAREAEFDRRRDQLEADRAEVAKQKELAQLMRADPVGGFNAYAKANGIDADGFYRELTEQHMGEGNGATPTRVQREIAELRKQQEQWQQEQTKAQEQARVQRHEAFLVQRIDELGSIRRNDQLRKLHPHLASMPEKRFQDEVTSTVLWLAKNDPQALNDPMELAKKLDDAAKDELESWYESRKGFIQADAAPAEAADTGNGTPGRTAKSHRRPDRTSTVTNADSSAHGGARDLDDEERFDRAGKLALQLFE